MRARTCLAGLALTVATAAPAFAEDGGSPSALSASVAVGAGQRGDEIYAGVEARLDGGWDQLRFGLALRGQWDDGRWRDDDFTTAAGWGSVLRYLETWHRWDGGEAAAALGSLRPAAIGRVSDGVQVGVDDRYHTGLRTRARVGQLELSGEIDDLFAPRFFAAEAGWRTERWRATLAAAVGASPWGDPAISMGSAAGPDEPGTEAAVELSLARRFLGKARAGAADEARLGLGVIGEPGEGAHAVGFLELETRARRTRVSLRADVRLGNGSLGLRFGPLYRLTALVPGDAVPSSGQVGLGAGLGLRVEREGAGWLETSLRAARDREDGAQHTIATAHLGAPITSRAQAGAWLAADGDRALAAAEVRAFGRAGTFLAVEASHLIRHRSQEMPEIGPLSEGEPSLGWAVIAWLGVSR